MKHFTIIFFVLWIGLPEITYSQTTKPEIPRHTAFLDKSGIDTTVLPGNDFYAYANGSWVKNTDIPADRVSWGSFVQIIQENQLKTKRLLEQLAQSAPQAPRLEQQVGDFFASGMDSALIDRRSVEPLEAEIAKISAITQYDQLVHHLITDQSNTVFVFGTPGRALVGYYVGPDDRQISINRLIFRQSGLSLPEKGYYTRQDEVTQKIRDAFTTYVTKLFTLTGLSPIVAQTKAQAILAFETRLAQAHKEQADLLNSSGNYHKFTVAELTRRMPHLNWRGLLSSIDQQGLDTVLIGQPAYYQTLDEVLPLTPLGVLKDKLLFNLLNYNAPLLSADIAQAHFEFNRKAIYGQQQPPTRWRQVTTLMDEEMGDALGQLWVKHYFPPTAKERVKKMVDGMVSVYRKRIEQLDWMSAETKSTALAKLDNVIVDIGYPDQWRDYSGLVIKRDDYYGNVQRARQHRNHLDLAKINQAVDRREWLMTTPTVNAYSNRSNNQLVFAPGILQFPYFDPDADDAINYGGIGTVIGHELTHQFDQLGRQHDATGSLRNWWTKQDSIQFERKTQTIISQFNAYTVLDNQPVNGQLTLGENLADLGGLTLAYQAFKLTKQGKGNAKIDGFTPDQRFFLSHAQKYRIKVRESTQRVWLRTDPHSPSRFRVNGPLSNFAPFYQAFDVKPGQKLCKEETDRAKVW